MSVPLAVPPAVGVRPVAPASRPGRGRTRLSATADRKWTVSILCVIVYLWLVHSFKLNIGSIVIGGGLLVCLMYERPLRMFEPLKWYAAYLGWSLLLLPLAIDVPVAWQSWTDALKLLIIAFLTSNAIRNQAQHRIITLAYLAMFAFYPVRGVMLNFLTGQSHFGRYGWNFTFANFNDLAALSLIPLAFAIDRLRSAEKLWIKACALVGLLVLPFIILITQSRGGMLGLAVFLMYLFARSRYRGRMLVASAVIAGGAVLFAPKAVWDRIVGMQYLTDTETLEQSDTSAKQRWIIMQVSGAVIASNPLGVGIGAYPVAHQKKAREKREWSMARGARDSHNTYLRVFAESGLIGFGLWIMTFVSTLRPLLKMSKEVRRDKSPRGKEFADRCQAYIACYVGLGVCGLFGTLNPLVFPYLLMAMTMTMIHLYEESKAPADRVRVSAKRAWRANQALPIAP